MLISLKAEDVSRMLTRPIKQLKELSEAVVPLIDSVMATADRPWWDLFGKMFSRKRDYAVMVAGIGTVENLSTLITRLESMKDLCDKHGAETVLMSHDDLHHIEVASKLVKQADAMLFSASGE